MKRLVAALIVCGLGTASAQTPPSEVKFYGPPTAVISAGVVIPANRASVWVSGTTPPIVKTDAATGLARYGDTKGQAKGVLKAIEGQLSALGLGMKDVVYVRAYLVQDRAKEGRIDVAGWNAAFTEVFGTAAAPNKPARSTVGVAALVNPDFLIEIEVFALYP